jgi:hypothetical protein
MSSWMSERNNTEEVPSIAELLFDPTASVWLKLALRSALCRDPVDAANDSQILARVLARRCDDILSGRQTSVDCRLG